MSNRKFMVFILLALTGVCVLVPQTLQPNIAANSRGALRSVPQAPILIAPLNHATAVRINPTFIWSSSSGASSYQLQISTDSTFATGVTSRTGISDTTYHFTGLAHKTIYYWRVSAIDGGGAGPFSAVWSFRSHVTPDFGGEIQSADAYIILRQVVGISILTGDALESLDVSGDGTVSAYDASIVLQVAAGLISPWPVDQ